MGLKRGAGVLILDEQALAKADKAGFDADGGAVTSKTLITCVLTYLQETGQLPREEPTVAKKSKKKKGC